MAGSKQVLKCQRKSACDTQRCFKPPAFSMSSPASNVLFSNSLCIFIYISSVFHASCRAGSLLLVKFYLEDISGDSVSLSLARSCLRPVVGTTYRSSLPLFEFRLELVAFLFVGTSCSFGSLASIHFKFEPSRMVISRVGMVLAIES